LITPGKSRPAEETTGVWSRDGKILAYRSAVQRATIMLKAASGLEPEKQIVQLSSAVDILPNSWTPDDKQILCTRFSVGASGYRAIDLVMVPASGGQPTPFLATKAWQMNGQISPDGKWVAYASNESGDWEIYVTTFPGAVGKWQVSRGGGIEPRWRGDGNEIFYIAPSGILLATPVSTVGTFSGSSPVPLFQVRGRAPISTTDVFTYDAAKDGERFLVNRYVQPDRVTPLTIVLNANADEQK
jgi:Tol biopolymer transport system component